MGGQRGLEVVQHVAALQSQRLHHRQQPLHVTAALLAVTAERTLATTPPDAVPVPPCCWSAPAPRGRRTSTSPAPGQQPPTGRRRLAQAQAAPHRSSTATSGRIASSISFCKPAPPPRAVAHLVPALEQHPRQPQQFGPDGRPGPARSTIAWKSRLRWPSTTAAGRPARVHTRPSGPYRGCPRTPRPEGPSARRRGGRRESRTGPPSGSPPPTASRGGRPFSSPLIDALTSARRTASATSAGPPPGRRRPDDPMADRAQGHGGADETSATSSTARLLRWQRPVRKARAAARRGPMLEARTSAGMAAWVTSRSRGSAGGPGTR